MSASIAGHLPTRLERKAWTRFATAPIRLATHIVLFVDVMDFPNRPPFVQSVNGIPPATKVAIEEPNNSVCLA
jgi:hypothetical protein